MQKKNLNNSATTRHFNVYQRRDVVLDANKTSKRRRVFYCVKSYKTPSLNKVNSTTTNSLSNSKNKKIIQKNAFTRKHTEVRERRKEGVSPKGKQCIIK